MASNTKYPNFRVDMLTKDIERVAITIPIPFDQREPNENDKSTFQNEFSTSLNDGKLQEGAAACPSKVSGFEPSDPYHRASPFALRPMASAPCKYIESSTDGQVLARRRKVRQNCGRLVGVPPKRDSRLLGAEDPAITSHTGNAIKSTDTIKIRRSGQPTEPITSTPNGDGSFDLSCLSKELRRASRTRKMSKGRRRRLKRAERRATMEEQQQTKTGNVVNMGSGPVPKQRTSGLDGYRKNRSRDMRTVLGQMRLLSPMDALLPPQPFTNYHSNSKRGAAADQGALYEPLFFIDTTGSKWT